MELHSVDFDPVVIDQLCELVNLELAARNTDDSDELTILQRRSDELSEQCNGWIKSLGSGRLSDRAREQIEAQLSDASDEIDRISRTLEARQNQPDTIEQVVRRAEIEHRLRRLPEILQRDNPTIGNHELANHIDRIECSSDGTVTLRICKLGAAQEAIPLLSKLTITDASDRDTDSASVDALRTGPRRRGRLRVGELDDDPSFDLDSARDFVADTHRFAHLADDWFWVDSFSIPKKQSWVEWNAEKVFRRRQEAQLSFGKLANEFGKSKPTIRAAIDLYLQEHPDEVDKVNLPRGTRPPKFDLSSFGEEARQLWEDGMSKLKLAKRFGCSPPTIDKALKWAYEQLGQEMPTKATCEARKTKRARQLHDEGKNLAEIAQTLKVSDVTARKYLKRSFESDRETPPDLRSRDTT